LPSLLPLVVGIATATIALGACSSSSKKPIATSSSLVTAGHDITIRNFKFAPNPLTVKVGGTVAVTNGDGTNHSLTADDGSFDTGVFSSGSRTIQLPRAGTFTFHCKIHNFMTGTVDVSP
jgi:plastocyanin